MRQEGGTDSALLYTKFGERLQERWPAIYERLSTHGTAKIRELSDCLESKTGHPKTQQGGQKQGGDQKSSFLDMALNK